MAWAAPAYAWLLLLAIPGGLLLHRAERRKLAALRALVGTDGVATLAARSNRLAWLRYAPAFLLVVAALCRPQWGQLAVAEPPPRGADILIALDVSRSMLADDLAPNRLAAAKAAISRLLPRLQGERVGLIAFAGSAFLICPYTTDYGLFAEVLAQAGPDTLPLGGTRLSAALGEALRATGGAVGPHESLLIVLSDGEDHGDDTHVATAALRGKGVVVHTVAFGTAQGSPIPLGDGRFVKDRAGRIVMSRLHDAPLRAIAAASGGRHVELGADASALDSLLDGVATAQATPASRTRMQMTERFQIPLALALLLFCLDPWIGGRGRS